MLITVVQQSDSITYIYMYVYILLHILSIMVYYRILKILSQAIQQDLAVYLLCI